MKTKVKKIVIVVGMVSLSLLGSLTGSMQAYAAGPSETQTIQAVRTTTYNQQSVKVLGSWEQQGSVWKFLSINGTYISNSWLESLSEMGAFYYVDSDGVMLTNSKTPDGYWVDANGLWRTQVVVAGDGNSDENSNGWTDSNKNTNYSSGITPEQQKELERLSLGISRYDGELH